MKQVVIFGASGHAHVIADIVRSCGDNVVAFLDDDINITDCSGPINDYKKYKKCEFIVGIGNDVVRERIASLPITWYTAVHPSAIISPSAEIGTGTVVMPNVVVNSNAKIGNHCIINTGAIIEHNAQISDYVHISVGVKLGGTVSIGTHTCVGIGAVVNNNISIHSNCIIGAGAVVVKNIEQTGTYIGVPAKRYEK